MGSPGASRPDPPAGIPALANVPPPAIVPARRIDPRQAGPPGGHQAERDHQGQRRLPDLGPLDLGCPRPRGVT